MKLYAAIVLCLIIVSCSPKSIVSSPETELDRDKDHALERGDLLDIPTNIGDFELILNRADFECKGTVPRRLLEMGNGSYCVNNTMVRYLHKDKTIFVDLGKVVSGKETYNQLMDSLKSPITHNGLELFHLTFKDLIWNPEEIDYVMVREAVEVSEKTPPGQTYLQYSEVNLTNPVFEWYVKRYPPQKREARAIDIPINLSYPNFIRGYTLIKADPLPECIDPSSQAESKDFGIDTPVCFKKIRLKYSKSDEPFSTFILIGKVVSNREGYLEWMKKSRQIESTNHTLVFRQDYRLSWVTADMIDVTSIEQTTTGSARHNKSPNVVDEWFLEQYPPDESKYVDNQTI